MDIVILSSLVLLQIVVLASITFLYHENKKIKQALNDALKNNSRLQAADISQAYMLRSTSKKVKELTIALDKIQESEINSQSHKKLISQIKQGYNQSAKEGEKQLSRSEADLIKLFHHS